VIFNNLDTSGILWTTKIHQIVEKPDFVTLEEQLELGKVGEEEKYFTENTQNMQNSKILNCIQR
jgi:hypothetical protein